MATRREGAWWTWAHSQRMRSMLAVYLVLHLAAAALAWHVLAPQLHPLLAATSRPAHAFALERALRRLLAAELLLPPLAPLGTIALVAAATAEMPASRRVWLVLGWAPQAIESLGRTVAVTVARPAVTVIALLEMPTRFDSGIGLLFDLRGARLGPRLTYWASALTLAAAASVMLWARALPEKDAHDASRNDLSAHALATVAALYLAMTFAVQLLAPSALALFLAA